MKSDIKSLTNFLTIDGKVLQVENIDIINNTLLLRVGDKALIAKPVNSLGRYSFELEMERRQEATSIAKNTLQYLVQDTEFMIMIGKENNLKKNEINLITRSVQWLENVDEVKKLNFKFIMNNPNIIKSIIDVCNFVLSQYFKNKRMFQGSSIVH